jgi:hypothetical protein
MTVSAIAKNFRDGKITLADGTAVTPLDVVVTYEDGDFSLSDMAQVVSGKSYEYAKHEDRGALFSQRRGRQKFPAFSFSAVFTDLSDAATENLVDMILRQNAFSGAVSTTLAKGDVYTLDVKLDVEGTDFGDTADHSITLEDCHMTVSISEGSPNKFTISGVCYGTITIA